MADIFAATLNMSLTASLIILIVLIVRMCLKNAPKIFSYVLWSVVLFRLLCPVSVSLPVSVLAPMSKASASAGTSYTTSMNYIFLQDKNYKQQSDIGINDIWDGDSEEKDIEMMTGISPDTSELDSYTYIEQKVSGEEIILTVLGWFWITGMVCMLVITVWQTASLRRRLAEACIIRGNVFESDKIENAFIFGVFNPKIYLPLGLPFDVQKTVIVHEQIHLHRADHIVKLISYFALAIHWFNPLAWLSFKLMCDDMEKSCDEAVIRKLNSRGYDEKSIKKGYSEMLFAFCSKKQKNTFSSVSFAENSIKERIINVTKFKRVSTVFSVVLGVVCIVIIGICMINPNIAAADIDNETSYGQFTIGDVTFKNDVIELDLSNQIIDDEAIECLEKCTQLKSLNLYESGVSDLSRIVNLPSLERLDLRYAGTPNYGRTEDEPCFTNFFSFEDIQKLENLGKLTELGITIPYRYNIHTDITYISEDDVQRLNEMVRENDFDSIKIAVYRDLDEYPSDKRVLTESADYSALVNLQHLTALVIGYDMCDMSVLLDLDELTELSLGRGYTSQHSYRGIYYDYTPVLEKMKDLTSLTIWSADAFSLYDYSCIGNMTELHTLVMSDCCLDYSFLYRLNGLKNLYIAMSANDRNDSAKIDIQKLADSSPSLTCTYFSWVYLNNISYINQFQQLESLYLMAVDNDAVENGIFDVSALYTLSSLQKLVIGSYKEISNEQIDKLEERYPNSEIIVYKTKY